MSVWDIQQSWQLYHFGVQSNWLSIRIRRQQQQQTHPSDNIESSALGGDADQAGLPYLEFDWNQDFLLQQEGLLETLPTTTNNNNNSTTGSGPETTKNNDNNNATADNDKTIITLGYS